jgi:coproporphyrinogen III oxidase-like Fe-S oxidoreductase
MPQRVWSQSLSVRDRACEATILGLRLMGGMSRDRLDELWDGAGIDVGVALDQLRADGLLEAGDSVRLTERGVALANEVFRAFV